jgi:hypothetical protein
MSYTPSLIVTEREGRVRLQLAGIAQGNGASLQEAADDLVRRVLAMAMAFRAGGFRISTEVRPDLETMSFLYELGALAAAGGDIRVRLFG